MVYVYCPACGRRLAKREIGDEGAVPYCEKCARPWFDVSHPCVIALVVNQYGEIALVKQAGISGNRFVCVAGYVKAGETAEEAVCREIREELGLYVTGMEYVNSYYYEKDDNLMLGFICRAEKGEFVISPELITAEWFGADEALQQLKEARVAKILLLEYIERYRAGAKPGC